MWLIVLALIVFIISLFYYKERRKLSKLKNFKIRYGLPILGFLGELYDPTEALKIAEKYVAEYKDSFAGFLGPKPFIVVLDDKTCETILHSSVLIDKSDEYKFFRNWFGLESLLVATGDVWHNRRKILTPAFHYKILEEFCLIFNECSNRLIEKLKNVAENSQEEIDINELVTLHTLDIICETAMGVQLNSINNPNSDILKSIKNLCHIMYTRVFSIFLRIDFIYKFTNSYKIEMESIKILHEFSDDIIKKRRRILMNKQNTIDSADEFGIKTKSTFLDILLQSKINDEYLTDKQIIEEVNTFMFEGHDTTTGALSFALYLLSRNYDVQQKVYEEILKLVGTNLDVPLTQTMLQSMTYTEMVIKESMRLYPSVPTIARVITEDTPCRGGIIQKGVTVAIIPYGLHRNPNIYPDPYKFDPERFTIDNCTKRNPYAYVPFSAGPRNCIGQKFAMLEMKATIAKILLHFELIQARGDYEVHPVSKVTIQSANGIKLRLKKR